MKNNDKTINLQDFPPSNNNQLISNNIKPLDEPKKNLIAWLILIIPLLLILFNIIIPILNIFFMSFRDINLLNARSIGQQEFVFLRNYLNLHNFQNYSTSLKNTLLDIFNIPKIILISILPLILAYFLSKVKSNIKLILLSLISLTAIGFSSIPFAIFFKIFSAKLGIILNQPMLNYIPFFARLANLFFCLGISSFLCLSVYLGIINSIKENMDSYWKKLLIFFIILLILIIGFSAQIFTPSYIINGSGINYSASNLMILIINLNFRIMKIGMGSALSTLLILPLLVLGICLGFILEFSKIKLWFADNNKLLNQNTNFNPIFIIFSILFIFLILLVFLIPLINLFKASFSSAVDFYTTNKLFTSNSFTKENFRLFTSKVPILKFYINSFGLIILPIFFQLILTIPTGYALGRLRFHGRKIIFIIITSLIFITPSLLIIPLYINGLSISKIIKLPIFLPYLFNLIISPIMIVLFKIYFEGTRFDISRIKNEKNSYNINKIKTKLIINTILMSLLAACISFIINFESTIPRMILTFMKSNTLDIELINFSASMITSMPSMAAGTVLLIILFFLPIVIPIIILQFLLLSKIRIIFDKNNI